MSKQPPKSSRSPILSLFIALFLIALVLFGSAQIELRLAHRAARLAEIAAEQTKLRRVTIREGLTRQEIAALLAKQGVVSAGEFLAITSHDEGHLFPDTYELKQGTPAFDVRQKLLDTYVLRTKAVNPTDDQLILASIVEREAKGDADRALIAGVYANRLKLGMKLEADPTVQYAKWTALGRAPTNQDGSKNYWAEITKADYQAVQSPYNTYLSAGLPPGPICNPGMASIKAVITPAETDALYFFHTKSGQAVFSKTLEEHTKKVSQQN